MAELFSDAVARPEGEFLIACAVSRFLGGGDGPEQLFADTISPWLENPADDGEALLNWFAQAKFRGPDELVTLAHSDLNFVLEYRQGIPITVGILLLETARRSGLEAFGINFPGHFLISISGQIIDPLALNILSSEYLASLSDGDSRKVDALLQPATVQMVALRMLNNVKAQHIQSHNFASALEVIDLQLACCGSEPELLSSFHFERGEYWQQIGGMQAAREAYQSCAQICPYPQLAAKAQELADSLLGNPDTLH
ncbi:MAG: transglutaminase family protein [Pseudomonadota bacterium]